MDPRRLFISFSGGETSAFMARWLLLNWRDRYDEIVCLMANTGEENEETLIFADACDRAFGLGLIWVEAVIHPGERKAPTHRIVDFSMAARRGEPFEASIAKYGIPNFKFKDCTRSLKLNPMKSYLRSIGWEENSYDTAIGIRADEIDRVSAAAKRNRVVYPLVALGMTKPMINAFWTGQAFRLPLKGYQGNCKWCWKKSLRKHLTLIGEAPEVFDFPRRMEATYGHVGPEFLKDPATRRSPLPSDYRRTFFRENRSVDDLFKLYAERSGSFMPADDDAKELPEPGLFDDLDVAGACGESCEVFADGDDDGR